MLVAVKEPWLAIHEAEEASEGLAEGELDNGGPCAIFELSMICGRDHGELRLR